MKFKYRSPYSVVLMTLGIPLALMASTAGAVYEIDGSKKTSTSPAAYDIPSDGMCVIGIKANGDLLVDKNITNSRDCEVYTANLTGLTSQATCAPAAGGGGSDGWRHQWTTSASFCRDTNNGAVGVSRVDLDRTSQMCTAKGATLGFGGYAPGGACIAYGWYYRGLKTNSDGTQSVPAISGSAADAPFTASNYAVFKGVNATDGLGFCFTTMDMTNAVAPAYNAATCPSATHPEWSTPSTGGSPVAGWSWANNQCKYTGGVKGKIAAAITVTEVGGAVIAPGTQVDLTQYTSQGDCLAHGYQWENWFAKTGVGDPPVPAGAALTNSANNQIALFDFTSGGKDGGARFTVRQCLRCHSDQSRTYMERTKFGFVKTGHKLSGDSTEDSTWAAIGNDWGLKGVQCAMCHAASNPVQADKIQITAAGAARNTSNHDADGYGAQVTQICYYCHSDATKGSGGSTTPATVIPVENGEFKQNAQHLSPIVNQFLNSPHAQYTGDSSGAQLQDKTKYASTFVGYLCRTAVDTGAGAAAGSIISTYWDGSNPQTIPALDSLNPLCTNAGVGAGSGAGGNWVKEGTVATNRQGNCSTCHDVHWSLDDSSNQAYNSAKSYRAEPIRRECTTCHENGAVSLSNAPQHNLTDLKHPAVEGSPAYGGGSTELTGTEENVACEICHMPKLTSAGSPMHLWRMSVDPTYTTAGTTQANLVAGEALVDLRSSCGQCHGTSGSAHLFTSAQVAQFAEGIHAGGAAYSTACADCHTKSVAHPTGARTPDECLDCHGTTRPGVVPTVTAACITCHAANGAAKHKFTATQLRGYAQRIHHGGRRPSTTCTTCHSDHPAKRVNHPVRIACATCHVRQGFDPPPSMACNPCHGGSSGRRHVSRNAPFIGASVLKKAIHKIHILPRRR